MHSSSTFKFELRSEGKNDFEYAFCIIFGVESEMKLHKVTHYRITEESGMVLYWHETSNNIPLPYEMHLEEARQFAWNWLKNATYPEKPDVDGSCRGGYLIRAGNLYESDHAITDGFYATVVVKPDWQIYGK